MSVSYSGATPIYKYIVLSHLRTTHTHTVWYDGHRLGRRTHHTQCVSATRAWGSRRGERRVRKTMDFFLQMIPPTVTHQEHKVMVKRGKPVFYEPPELKAARSKLMDALARRRPDHPFDGALRLTTKWIWPLDAYKVGRLMQTGKHDYAEYKVTKPDTDNIIKMLKDCMTKCKFWHDDAQVASEITEKFLGMHPGIYVRIEEIGNDST